MHTKETNPLTLIRSVMGTNFTGAAVTNARLDEDIAFPNEIKNSHEVMIESVALIATQNLSYDFYFFSGAAKSNASPDLDTFLDFISFDAAAGFQIAGSGLYYYSRAGLNLNYKDVDETTPAALLHVSLVNRSATSKSAGAGGRLVLLVACRPIYFS